MAKAKKTAFFCQNCGYESAKWMGQCPACREWNTFVEEPMAAKTPAGNQGLGSHSAAGRKPVHLTEISTGKEERIPTGIGELDRVLGGGIVPGSLTLVGGDPGIGKSTLLLQVCRMLSTAGHQVLYISGEESLRQIKLRAVRIGEFNENLSLLCETNLDIIRAVSMAEQRVLEAKKLGFERVILPAVCMKSVEKIGGIALIPVENIQDAILRVGKN